MEEEFINISSESEIESISNIENELNAKDSNDQNNKDKLNKVKNKKQKKSYENNESNLNCIQKLTETTNLSSNLILKLNESNKWIMILDWDIKEKLIRVLNEFTKLLFMNGKVSPVIEQKLKIDKIHLINKLNRLPLKLNEKIESNSYNIIMNIENSFKNEIVDQLIKNEYFAIKFKNKIDENSKIELINENNQLVIKLISLPIEIVKNQLNTKLEVNESNNEQILEFEDLKSTIMNLREETNRLNSILSSNCKLDYQFVRLNLTKRDINNFLAGDNLFQSNPLIYLNIEWCISIESKIDNLDYKRYLQVHLKADNKFDNANFIKWDANISYEIILKNTLVNERDQKMAFTNTFSNVSNKWGVHRFIDSDQILNAVNGFISNNCIYLEINFKVNRLNRFI